MVISFLGLFETGRPPFLTVARASILAESSGSSSYSRALTTWESTRLRSDFKERRDAPFFTAIGFPHTKYVSSTPSRRVSHNHQPGLKVPEADDARFAVVLAGVFDFERRAGKHQRSVLKIEATFLECLAALGRIVSYPHLLL